MNMLARNFPHLLKSRQARNKTSDIPRTIIQATAPNSGEFSWNQCVFFGNTSVLSGSFSAAISLFLLVRKHGWEFYSSKIDLNLSAKFLSSLFNCLIQQPKASFTNFHVSIPFHHHLVGSSPSKGCTASCHLVYQAWNETAIILSWPSSQVCPLHSSHFFHISSKADQPCTQYRFLVHSCKMKYPDFFSVSLLFLCLLIVYSFPPKFYDFTSLHPAMLFLVPCSRNNDLCLDTSVKLSSPEKFFFPSKRRKGQEGTIIFH